MVCIYCGNPTKVTNSRLQRKINQVWRRRQCLVCGAIFSTEEQAVTENSIMVNHKGHIEPFSREKLLIDVYDSLKHRNTALNDARGLTDTIWGRLLPFIINASLKRDDIVSTTYGVLERFDTAAATAYLAFHPRKKN